MWPRESQVASPFLHHMLIELKPGTFWGHSFHSMRNDRPHKFQAGPDWVMVTASKMSAGTEGVQPRVTTYELDFLDKELGKDNVKDVLGDYFNEMQNAVKELICANPGLTGSESMEAMDVDAESPLEPAVDTQDQPMETEQSESSPGTFQPELGMPGYTLSLIRSTNSLPSPITAEDNALLTTSLRHQKLDDRRVH